MMGEETVLRINSYEIKPAANLRWANLGGADLSGADLSWTTLCNCDFPLEP